MLNSNSNDILSYVLQILAYVYLFLMTGMMSSCLKLILLLNSVRVTYIIFLSYDCCRPNYSLNY